MPALFGHFLYVRHKQVPGGDWTGSCKACGAVVPGKVYRLQAHLSKCVESKSLAVPAKRPKLGQRTLAAKPTVSHNFLAQLLARVVFSLNLPFSCTSNKEFRKLLHTIDPFFAIPTPHALGEKYLLQEYDIQRYV